MKTKASVGWRASAWFRTRILNALPGRIARVGHAAARAFDLGVTQRAGPPTILVTHDLSRSGAPYLILEIARQLVADGHNVLILSPSSGPFLADLLAARIRVIIDPNLAKAGYVDALAQSARMAICNTVETAEIVGRLATRTPTLWYLHEVSLLARRLAEPTVQQATAAVSMIWAGSPMCADLIRPHRSDVRIVPYGIEQLPRGTRRTGGPLLIGVFGSIEERKGQDLVLAAAKLLPPATRDQVRIRFYGRVLEADFAAPILAAADGKLLSYGGELDRHGYVEAISHVDAVLISSRDDTLPLVSIDALGLGTMLLLVPTVGTTAWLNDGIDALIGSSTTAAGICELIERAVTARQNSAAMGAAAKLTFAANFSRSAFHHHLQSSVTSLANSR